MAAAPSPDTGAAPAAPTTGAVGCDAALNVASTYGAYTPNQLATAYNFDALTQQGEQGQGQIVGVLEVDDFRDANVAAYQNCFGTGVQVTRVPVDGGTHPGPFEEEAELDVEVMIGMLPKLQQLLVYESDFRITSIMDSLQTMANDNLASVVSISFGGCEQNRNVNTFIMPENTIFEQMAAQGQSVFASSGDSGSRDCLLHHTQTANALAVDDPASQPYVTGVGGTKLTIDPTTNAYTGETVWNGFSAGGGAGGGGLSSVWPQPAYQSGPGVANSYSNGKRQVPDVAANADPKSGFIIYSVDPQTCGRVGGQCRRQLLHVHRRDERGRADLGRHRDTDQPASPRCGLPAPRLRQPAHLSTREHRQQRLPRHHDRPQLRRSPPATARATRATRRRRAMTSRPASAPSMRARSPMPR